MQRLNYFKNHEYTLDEFRAKVKHEFNIEVLNFDLFKLDNAATCITKGKSI